MAITLTGALALQKFKDHHGLSDEWLKTTLGAMPPAWKVKIKDEKLFVYDAFGEAKTGVYWKHNTAVNDLAKAIASADLTAPANAMNPAAPYTLLVGDEALAKLVYEGWAGAPRIKWIKENLPNGLKVTLTKNLLGVTPIGVGTAPGLAAGWVKGPGCVDKLVEWIKAYKIADPSISLNEILKNADFAEGGYKTTKGFDAVDTLVAEKIINTYTASAIKVSLLTHNPSNCFIQVSEKQVLCGVPLKSGSSKTLTFHKDTAGVGAQIAACFIHTKSDLDHDEAYAKAATVPDEIAKKIQEDPVVQLDTFVANSAMALLTGKATPATETAKIQTVQVGSATDYPVYAAAMAKMEAVPLYGACGLYRAVKGSTAGSRYFLVADMGGLKLAARIKDNKLSLRVEGPEFNLHVATLTALGLDVQGSYASTHVILCSTGLKDFIDAKRAVAALIAGLDLPVLSPPADLQLILGKGA